MSENGDMVQEHLGHNDDDDAKRHNLRGIFYLNAKRTCKSNPAEERL